MFTPEIEHVAHNEYHRYVSDLFKPMPTKVECLMHAAVGMSGEVSELYERFSILAEDEDTDITVARNDENVHEELGDLRFYITAAMLELGLTEAWVKEQDVATEFYDGEGVVGLVVYTGRFLDCIKKAWAYGKPLADFREDLNTALCHVFQSYKRACDFMELADPYLRCCNVKKLSARYPLGRYSDADALARADKQVGHNVPHRPLRERVAAALDKASNADYPQPLSGNLQDLRHWYNGDDLQHDAAVVEEILAEVCMELG